MQVIQTRQIEDQKTKNLDLSFLIKTHLRGNAALNVQITSLNIAKLSSGTLHFLHVVFTFETKANRKFPPTKFYTDIHKLLKALKETN